jgi:hypothetical protein
MPIHVKRKLFSPRLDFLSKRGIRKKNSIPQEISIIAIISPFNPMISPGNNFNVWKRKRKYHSGFIFSGVGARGSAFFPISGGKSVERVTTIPRTISHIIRSL